MVTYVQYQLATKVFSLIHMVPDRVSRWFGVGAEHLGEQQDTDKAMSVIMGGIHKGEGALNSGLMSSKKKLAPKEPGTPPVGPTNQNDDGM